MCWHCIDADAYARVESARTSTDKDYRDESNDDDTYSEREHIQVKTALRLGIYLVLEPRAYRE